MSLFTSDIMHGFGFHSEATLNRTPKSPSSDLPTKTCGPSMGGHIVTTILSWIPGISIISAIYDFVIAHKCAAQAKELRKSAEEWSNSSEKIGLIAKANEDALACEHLAQSYRARGTATLLQASVLLMIFDIGATIGRFRR